MKKYLLIILLFDIGFVYSQSDLVQELYGNKYCSSDICLTFEFGEIKLNGSTAYFNVSFDSNSGLVLAESISNPNGRLKLYYNSSSNCLYSPEDKLNFCEKNDISTSEKRSYSRDRIETINTQSYKKKSNNSPRKLNKSKSELIINYQEIYSFEDLTLLSRFIQDTLQKINYYQRCFEIYSLEKLKSEISKSNLSNRKILSFVTKNCSKDEFSYDNVKMVPADIRERIESLDKSLLINAKSIPKDEIKFVINDLAYVYAELCRCSFIAEKLPIIQIRKECGAGTVLVEYAEIMDRDIVEINTNSINIELKNLLLSKKGIEMFSINTAISMFNNNMEFMSYASLRTDDRWSHSYELKGRLDEYYKIIVSSIELKTVEKGIWEKL